MKTLDQHNEERSEYYKEQRRLREPHSNGISCPQCHNELWDSDPTMILTSNPPQMNIHCPVCGYRGYRLK